MLVARRLAGMLMVGTTSFSGSVFAFAPAELGSVQTAAPVGVSPGVAEGVARAARCSGFSWGRVEDALVYELAIYSLEESVAESEPVLSLQVPGTATAVTPSVDACPARGARYAWVVRAITPRGPSAWSEPLFFEVEAPSEEDIAWARELLSHVVGGDEPAVRGATPGEVRVERLEAESTGAILRVRDARVARESVVRASSPAIVPSVPAAFRVAGELRTPDAGDPDGLSRVWGVGRVGLDGVNGFLHFMGFEAPCLHEGIRYGLSDIEVNWGSAASACPAGTWVCEESEVAACNTVRTDDTVDGISCTGTPIDYAADGHVGWLAVDQGSGAPGMFEHGIFGTGAACLTLPVWCCWE